MGREGYTGPTSGRIRIGGGQDPEVTREMFYDRPLTPDESRAVKWFTDLSPIEQLREVRRLKWNLDEARRGRDVNLSRAREAEAEADRMRAERNARRPDGYELPRAAGALLEHARHHTWKTAREWSVPEDGYARLEVRIGRDGWTFQLAWSVPEGGDGAGSMIRTGLARRPGRGWYDAPSLKRIREIIREVDENGADPDPASGPAAP